jgi:hypothetical protein
MRCSVCLGPLRAKGGTTRKKADTYWTYSCIKDAYHASACGRVHIRGDHTDRHIEGIVLAHLRLPAVRAALTRGSTGPGAVPEDEATLRAEALKLREQIVSVEVAWMLGPAELESRHGISPEGYRLWRADALARRDELERRIGLSIRSRSVVAALMDPQAAWAQATLEERREVVRSVLPEIVVSPAPSLPTFPQRWNPRRIAWTAAG